MFRALRLVLPLSITTTYKSNLFAIYLLNIIIRIYLFTIDITVIELLRVSELQRPNELHLVIFWQSHHRSRMVKISIPTYYTNRYFTSLNCCRIPPLFQCVYINTVSLHLEIYAKNYISCVLWRLLLFNSWLTTALHTEFLVLNWHFVFIFFIWVWLFISFCLRQSANVRHTLLGLTWYRYNFGSRL